MRLQRVVFLFLICLFSLIGTAKEVFADNRIQGYSKPNIYSLSQTYIKMVLNTLPAEEVSKNINDYAQLMFCELYNKEYNNDFKWNRITRQLVEKIRQEKSIFPKYYEFIGPVQLGRYDFDHEYFPLTAETAINKASVMQIYETEPQFVQCLRHRLNRMFPLDYYIQLSSPLNIQKIHMSPGKAELLIQNIEESGDNAVREVYIRFRVEIVSLLQTEGIGKNTQPKAIFKVNVKSVDFFEDKEFTRFISSAAEY